MESKQMTLRSQTVQCPHCGEYYSVTYKYCPFCDAGRKAEARKKAARKQQATSLFTGLFSGRDAAEEGMDVPVRESGREAPRQHRRPAHTEEAPSGEPRRHRAPVSTPIPRSEGFRKKKTSEMTEEEKRAYRAEREARAAARKRERDRAARAAALVDIAGPAEEAPAENEIPASNAAPVISPTGMETVEITIDPMNTAPGELGVTEPAAQPQAEDSAREALQDLQLDDAGDQMNAAPAAAESFPAAEIPQPVEVEVPTPVPEVKPRPIDPASILQGDSELDALLTEIRGLLDEGPAVKAAPEAAGAPETAAPPLTETPAAPEAPSAPEPTADTAAAPEEAPAAPEAAPAVSEAVQAAGEAVSAPAEEVQAAPVEEDDNEPELLWSPETTAAVEAVAMRKTEPARTRRTSQTRQGKKPRKQGGLPLVPIIAAVIVIALAALLVTKVIAPAIQKSKEAETVTLSQSEVTFTEPEATEALTPVFEPKGSTGEIKWTCTNWGVVDVNPEGLLTAKAPGTATVAATLSNGSTASVTVNCTWGDAPAEGAVAEAPAPVGLNASEITLDGEGKTQTLTLSGVAGAVKWTSSKPAVATVSADGTVTAVSKGSAVITAMSNGSKYTCNVKCIW